MLCVFFIFFDIVRHHNRTIRGIYERYLIGTVIREKEQYRFVGSTYFMVGTCLCIWLFDKAIAIVSLLVLIVSDTLAALVGSAIGRIPLFGVKTVEGSMAFLLSAVLIVFLYPGIPLLPGLAGAFLATLVESLPLGVDDNLLIPLVIGLTIQGLNLL